MLDADGAVTFAAGAVDRPDPAAVVEQAGAGDGPAGGRLDAPLAAELAIGAGSHNGEDGHRELAAAMLAAVGLTPDDLGLPAGAAAARADEGRLAGRAAGRPTGWR